MDTKHLQNLVIGCGEGGKFLAWHLAQSGQSTAVVERRWIGGSCPNINCLPSKNEIHSAAVAETVRHAASSGTVASGFRVDMAAVRARKRAMVETLVAMNLHRFTTSGAELILGEARFTAAKTVHVQLNAGGVQVLTAQRIFLNLGTHAAVPDIPGLRAAGPMTHIEALERDDLPPHLIVLGGGYVGLELAQAYRRFGSDVTVIDRGTLLGGREDPDVTAEIARILAASGITLIRQAEIRRVQGRSGSEVAVQLCCDAGELTVAGSDLLVAAGRIPNTDGLGLSLAGVELATHGTIQVNDRLETSADGIWAIGECAGSPQFTHASFDDFRVIRDNLAGGARSTRGRLMPYCMFVDPPLARVGLNETQARAAGLAVRVARLPIRSVLRAHTTGQLDGFMKVLISTTDDRILGFSMIGAEAGEVMAAVQTAMLGNLPFTLLRDAILTHPTMAEGLGLLLSAVPPN